jgi:hypothetical protein
VQATEMEKDSLAVRLQTKTSKPKAYMVALGNTVTTIAELLLLSALTLEFFAVLQ